MSPNRWPMERRASSILPNPFWSDRTKQNFQLEAAKPMDLPKLPSEGEDTSGEGSVMSAKPVEDVTRGRGVSRNEHRNESRERRFEESKYKTPPSEREGVTGGSGRQNEGRMRTRQERAEAKSEKGKNLSSSRGSWRKRWWCCSETKMPSWWLRWRSSRLAMHKHKQHKQLTSLGLQSARQKHHSQSHRRHQGRKHTTQEPGTHQEGQKSLRVPHRRIQHHLHHCYPHILHRFGMDMNHCKSTDVEREEFVMRGHGNQQHQQAACQLGRGTWMPHEHSKTLPRQCWGERFTPEPGQTSAMGRNAAAALMQAVPADMKKDI